MKVANTSKEELKQKIRLFIFKNPKATCRETANVFLIDKDYANTLLNEIRTENKSKVENEITNLSTNSLEDDLNSLNNEFRGIKKKLLYIADDPSSTNTQQINALKAIIQSKIEIFKLKAHIGLFKEQSSKSELTMSELVSLVKTK